MKIRTIFLMGFTALVSSSYCYGHGGGHHSAPKIAECKVQDCSEDELLKAVKKVVIPKYVKMGKLSKSWLNASVKKIELKKSSHEDEWILQYFNKEESEAKKSNLYVFMTKSGGLSGINHSGR